MIIRYDQDLGITLIDDHAGAGALCLVLIHLAEQASRIGNALVRDGHDGRSTFLGNLRYRIG